MAQTMTSKILSRASGLTNVTPGDVFLAQVALFSSLDGAGFIDPIQQRGLKVWDPERMIFCFDHFFQLDWFPRFASKEHGKIRRFAKEQSIPPANVFDIGRNGISHHIPVEQGFALPGTVCVGVDTQFATVGAANTFAIPLLYAATPVALTGQVWIRAPEVLRVNVHGSLPLGILGKDIGYRLMKDLGDTVNGGVIEFGGPGLASLPVEVRMGIANCAVQIGALTIIFPADDLLLEYIGSRAKREFTPANPDPDAEYSAVYDYDLSDMQCLIAGPHDIDLIRTIGEVVGLEVQAANIGSCSSGRFEDLALAARVLKGRKISPGVRLAVTPISAETMQRAEAAGFIRTFVDAGAMVTQPGCGSCYSGNLGPIRLDENERCISSSVETVAGRMGAASAEIFLGNAAVVAASAIEGRIADPARYLAGNLDGKGNGQ